jgi:hypothetical protein
MTSQPVDNEIQKVDLSKLETVSNVDEAGSVENPSVSLQDRINQRLRKQAGTMQNQMDIANDRVDKARERAAARTKGCGSTKSCS